MNKINPELVNELFVRLIILCLYQILTYVEPLERTIQPEEIWLYRYPLTQSYFSMNCLWAIIFLTTVVIIIISHYLVDGVDNDLEAALLAISLSIVLTAALTRLLKVVVGKPRPDFYYRCFPRGYANDQMICNGDKRRINEGRQSFPSGHASISFAGMGFISLYLMGKLKVYKYNGSGNSWRVLVCLLPIVLASLVGISRVCDYHHHAVDVLAGALLGSFMATISYHVYYPPFYSSSCDVPHPNHHKKVQF